MSYAALFYSLRNDHEQAEYEAMTEKIEDLVRIQEGYLEHFSSRNSDGYDVTISYWESLADLAAWKENSDHQNAQKKDQKLWYINYRLEICKVEREYPV